MNWQLITTAGSAFFALSLPKRGRLAEVSTMKNRRCTLCGKPKQPLEYHKRHGPRGATVIGDVMANLMMESREKGLAV